MTHVSCSNFIACMVPIAGPLTCEYHLQKFNRKFNKRTVTSSSPVLKQGQVVKRHRHHKIGNSPSTEKGQLLLSGIVGSVSTLAITISTYALGVLSPMSFGCAFSTYSLLALHQGYSFYLSTKN